MEVNDADCQVTLALRIEAEYEPTFRCWKRNDASLARIVCCLARAGTQAREHRSNQQKHFLQLPSRSPGERIHSIPGTVRNSFRNCAVQQFGRTHQYSNYFGSN